MNSLTTHYRRSQLIALPVKDSLWLKILSCYVPAFSHIRRGGPGYSPTTRIWLLCNPPQQR